MAVTRRALGLPPRQYGHTVRQRQACPCGRAAPPVARGMPPSRRKPAAARAGGPRCASRGAHPSQPGLDNAPATALPRHVGFSTCCAISRVVPTVARDARQTSIGPGQPANEDENARGVPRGSGGRGRLVTDPSGPQLQGARRHAQERELAWVRFLQAPAEDLPLASGTVDLVLGAIFLHFTEPAQALREMFRVVRPGGRVAICAGREFDWTGPWPDVLDPVRRELAALGLPFQHQFLKAGALIGRVTAAGLQVERVSETGPDQWAFPSVQAAGGRSASRLPATGCGADALATLASSRGVPLPPRAPGVEEGHQRLVAVHRPAATAQQLPRQPGQQVIQRAAARRLGGPPPERDGHNGRDG